MQFMKKSNALKVGLWLLSAGLAAQGLLASSQGEIEVTGQATRRVQDSSKFEEYRTVPEGVFVENMKMDTLHENSNCYFNIMGSKLGLDDQNFRLEGGKSGLLKLNLKYDQIPHLYSLTGKSFYQHDGSGRLTVSDQVQVDLQTSTYNAVRVFSDVPFVDLKTRRDAFESNLAWTPLDKWAFKFNASKENRKGSKPLGVTLGSNLIEVPEPVNTETTNFGFNALFGQGSFNSIFSYQGSMFDNNIDALTVDNIWQSTATASSASGGSTPDKIQLAGAPDNQQHTLSLAAGSNLPFWNSRMNAYIAYGMNLQNQKFLAPTVNQALLNRAQTLGVNLNPPRDSLDGRVNTLNANANLVMRPLQPLSLTGKVRYYKYDNQTNELLMNQYVAYDAAFSTSNPLVNFNTARQRRAASLGYSTLNIGADGSYQILSSLAFNAGYSWEKTHRENRDVVDVYENTFKTSLNFTPKKWVSLHPNYQHSARFNTNYDIEVLDHHIYPLGEGTNALGSMDDMRRFDEANRLRDVAGLKANFMPFDSLSLQTEYAYRYDNYDGSLYGLLNERNNSVAVDVYYDPLEALSLFGNYAHEEQISNTKSRYRESGSTTRLPYDLGANDWAGQAFDITDTFGVGTLSRLFHDKLGLDFSYTMSRSKGENRAMNPNVTVVDTTKGSASSTKATAVLAVDYRETKTETHKLLAGATMKITENLSTRLRYSYERYMVDDFAFEFIQPWQSVWFNSTFMDATQGDYAVHVMALSLIYKF